MSQLKPVGIFLTCLILTLISLFFANRFFGIPSLHLNTISTQTNQTYIAGGQAEVSAPPDSATLTVGVTSNDQTVEQAQNKLNQSMNSLTQALLKLGLDKSMLQTQNYNVYPQSDPNSPNKISGYTASSNLEITIKDLSKINSIIDTATANGANQIGQINFTISDKSSLENQARAKAVTQAKNSAKQAASTVGFGLGPLINYSESFDSNSPQPFFAAKVSTDNKLQSPTEIQAGQNSIRISVSLTYQIY